MVGLVIEYIQYVNTCAKILKAITIKNQKPTCRFLIFYGYCFEDFLSGFLLLFLDMIFVLLIKIFLISGDLSLSVSIQKSTSWWLMRTGYCMCSHILYDKIFQKFVYIYIYIHTHIYIFTLYIYIYIYIYYNSLWLILSHLEG